MSEIGVLWTLVQGTTVPNLKADELLVFLGRYMIYTKKRYGDFKVLICL